MAPSTLALIGTGFGLPYSAFCAAAPAAAVSTFYPKHKGNKALESSIRTYGLFHTYSSLYVLIADSQVNKDDKTRAGVLATSAAVCVLDGFHLLNSKKHNDMDFKYTEASAAGLFALAIACGVKAVSHWKAASDADSKAAAPAKPKSCPKCKGACKCAPAAGAKKK